jgi:signal transduction histidine kinase/ActR/RegA family two-component response regulator
MRSMTTTALMPPDQAARLLVLDPMCILDTPADPVLDSLVRSVAAVLDCPIALVSLVAEGRHGLKAGAGLDVAEFEGELVFCAETMRSDEAFEVPDARLDPRFAANALVTGAPHVRFYAGMPLRVGGRAIGTLCVIDHRPRTLGAAQRTLLADLAHAVEHWIVSWREHNELREYQRFLGNIARHVSGMFFQFRLAADGSCHFPFASSGIDSIYELTPQDVGRDGAVALARLHPDHQHDVRHAIWRSATTLAPWNQQYRVCLPERGERWLEGHATPQRVDDGSVLWHGFIHDITSRREVGHAKREQVASERASQAKSEFLSRLSHELRTPLNSVLGFTQLMQEDDQLPDRARAQLEHIRKAGAHLVDLVGDMLDLTRIEQGLHDLTLGRVAVTTVIDEALQMLEPLALEYGVHLMPLQGDADAIVRADARALGQVLMNLLSNGTKYNHCDGLLWIEVRKAGPTVVISVNDEGPGLTEAQRARLFRPFERLGAERSRVPGSGLGLVITKQLVEAMRGALAVHPRAEGGCRFEVRLPAWREFPITRPASLDAANDESPDLPLVLCVEDDPLSALLLREAVRSVSRCRLRFTNDGGEALRMARELRPELVITDLNLLGTDGYALVRALRADPLLRETRCIGLSGNADPHTHELALDAGFDAYWTKPLDLNRLRLEVADAERRDAQKRSGTDNNRNGGAL